MDLNVVVGWTLAFSFLGAILFVRRSMGTGARTPWGRFLAALPVAFFSEVFVLRGLVDLAGPVSVGAMGTLAVVAALATAGAAAWVHGLPRRPWTAPTAFGLAVPPVLLAFVPLPDLPAGADIVLFVGGLAAAACLPAGLAWTAGGSTPRRGVRAAVLLALFAAVVFQGAGLAIALGHPFTEVRRDLEIGIDVPAGQNVTLSVYFPGLVAELQDRLRVTAGEATIAGKGADIHIRARGPVRVEGHAAFFASKPLPEATAPPTFVNASHALTLHFKVYSGFASGDGCSIGLDKLIEVRAGHTVPIEFGGRCVD